MGFLLWFALYLYNCTFVVILDYDLWLCELSKAEDDLSKDMIPGCVTRRTRRLWWEILTLSCFDTLNGKYCIFGNI